MILACDLVVRLKSLLLDLFRLLRDQSTAVRGIAQGLTTSTGGAADASDVIFSIVLVTSN